MGPKRITSAREARAVLDGLTKRAPSKRATAITESRDGAVAVHTLHQRGRTFTARFDPAVHKRNKGLPGSQARPEITLQLDGHEVGAAQGIYRDDGRANWSDMATNGGFTPAELKARAWESETDGGAWREKALQRLVAHAAAAALK